MKTAKRRVFSQLTGFRKKSLNGFIETQHFQLTIDFLFLKANPLEEGTTFLCLILFFCLEHISLIISLGSLCWFLCIK